MSLIIRKCEEIVSLLVKSKLKIKSKKDVENSLNDIFKSLSIDLTLINEKANENTLNILFNLLYTKNEEDESDQIKGVNVILPENFVSRKSIDKSDESDSYLNESFL